MSEKKRQLHRIVLSELPETMRRSRYCRQAIPRLCPFSVRINSLVTVLQTLIVRSPDADTMYLSSKSTTLTAARWPTRTRRSVMSIAECMSQTAIERSCTHSHIIIVSSNHLTWRHSVMSIAECMSQTAIERSCTHSHIIIVSSNHLTWSTVTACHICT